MATQLLVDSNSYFRLAKIITPLLGKDFGEPPFSMHVIPELDEEFNKSSRLTNKFPWVIENQYKENRKNNIVGADIPKFDIKQTIKFMKDHKFKNNLGVSRVDIVVVAIAYNLNITIISDDADLQKMVKDFGMTECMSSLEVLLWLHEIEYLDLVQVQAAAQSWLKDKDLPMGKNRFIEQFVEMFGANPW